MSQRCLVSHACVSTSTHVFRIACVPSRVDVCPPTCSLCPSAVSPVMRVSRLRPMSFGLRVSRPVSQTRKAASSMSLTGVLSSSVCLKRVAFVSTHVCLSGRVCLDSSLLRVYYVPRILSLSDHTSISCDLSIPAPGRSSKGVAPSEIEILISCDVLIETHWTNRVHEFLDGGHSRPGPENAMYRCMIGGLREWIRTTYMCMIGRGGSLRTRSP